MRWLIAALIFMSAALESECTVAARPSVVYYRLGEASNPGPGWTGGLDDDEFDPFEHLEGADDTGQFPPSLIETDDEATVGAEICDDTDSDESGTDADGLFDFSEEAEDDWRKVANEYKLNIERKAKQQAADGRCHTGVSAAPGLEFFHASFWAGPVDGYVFTTRGKITGYYRDHVAATAKATPIFLQAAVPPPEDVEHKMFAGKAARHRLGANGKRVYGKGRARVATTGQPCAGPTVGYTQWADATAKEDGLWIIDTANPNSWTTAEASGLPRSCADVLLLQESKRFGEHADEQVKKSGRDLGWNCAVATALRTAADKGSGGCIVGAKRGIGIAGHEHVVSEAIKHRCCFAWVSAMLKGGVHFGSIYLKDLVGMDDTNMAILQEVAAAITALKGPWILGGDWDLEPHVLQGSGFLRMVRGTMVAPALPTCNGKTYDYFVVSERLAHLVAGVARIEDGGLHPHWPSRLYVRADGRRHLVRKIVRPERVPGVLPFGPLPKPAGLAASLEKSVDKETLDESAHAWLAAARAEWASLTGGSAAVVQPRSGSHGSLRLDQRLENRRVFLLSLHYGVPPPDVSTRSLPSLTAPFRRPTPLPAGTSPTS